MQLCARFIYRYQGKRCGRMHVYVVSWSSFFPLSSESEVDGGLFQGIVSGATTWLVWLVSCFTPMGVQLTWDALFVSAPSEKYTLSG